jgi:protoheme ferro-lyase
MKYAGLTDDPVKSKQEHGDPVDWRVEKTFAAEEEARKWEKGTLALGYQGGAGETGWRYGYTYTITEGTRQ